MHITKPLNVLQTLSPKDLERISGAVALLRSVGEDRALCGPSLDDLAHTDTLEECIKLLKGLSPQLVDQVWAHLSSKSAKGE